MKCWEIGVATRCNGGGQEKFIKRICIAEDVNEEPSFTLDPAGCEVGA